MTDEPMTDEYADDPAGAAARLKHAAVELLYAVDKLGPYAAAGSGDPADLAPEIVEAVQRLPAHAVFAAAGLVAATVPDGGGLSRRILSERRRHQAGEVSPRRAVAVACDRLLAAVAASAVAGPPDAENGVTH